MMRVLINKVLLFLLPLVVIGGIMEVLLRHIPNVYQYKKEYLTSNSDSVKILILGNSHSYFGLNPDYLAGNSFNAAHVSQTLEYDLAILRKFEPRWSDLEYIILPISYFSLYDKMSGSGEAWRAKDYRIYYDIDVSKYLPNYSEMLSGQLWVKFKRLWSYYGKKIDNVACSASGWGTDYRTSRTSINLTQAGEFAAQKHRRYDDVNFNEVCSKLDSIISFTEKHGAYLIMFTPPAYESYRNNLNEGQLNRTINTVTLKTNSKSYCTYINLLDSDLFVKSDFYDADHLNEIGARKLTQIMDNIINNKSGSITQ